MRNHKNSGMTIVELTIAMGVIATMVMVSLAFVGTNTREVTLNEDRAYAVQKATMMVSELRGVAERPDTEDASTLDSYDDGTGTSNILCADLTVDDPAHEFSGNIQFDQRWRYSRRITVRKFPSLDTRDVRIVTVRVFLTSAALQDDTTLAEVTSVINTVATAYPPSQVYDTYLLACENVPGWWVYMSYIRPFVENAFDDLEARQPGLVFRRHWITKLGYGRDPLYQPYFNKAVDSNQPINWVYFYPGTMPTGSAVDQYYVPDQVKARVNVDGTTKNGYDGDPDSETYNPYPYALADQFNHCMRQPLEKATFDQRVAAGQDTVDSPTWHLLLDDMIANPNNYRNAIFINFHGELVPFPPVRNYSDAAKEPATIPDVRVVTHPQKICFTQSEPLSLRVYGYYEDGGAFTTTTLAIAAGAASITVASTTGFPSSGTISLEGNYVRYTGVTATTFTGCTNVVAHPWTGVPVYDGSPATTGWASTPTTAAVGAGAATINVTRTNGFLPNGQVLIEADLISYTGLTATSFTGCSNVDAHPSIGVAAYQYLGRTDWSTRPVTVFLPALDLDQAGDVTINEVLGGTDQEPADRVADPYASCVAPTTAGSGTTGNRMYATVAYLNANPPTTPVAGTLITLYNTPLKTPGALAVPVTATSAAVAAGAATINVASTAMFPTSGQINCEGNVIVYGGVTPTSFTGCTGAVAHAASARVYPVSIVASTTNTAAVAIAAATITVGSTASFPPSGRIRLEMDWIAYTGKTATTFTGCTGVLNAHAVGRTVYASTGAAPTTTAGAVGAGAATLNVGSTAGFPSTGTLSIEGNLIYYTGTTATSFTGCRGVAAHATGMDVIPTVVPSTNLGAAVAAAAVTVTVLSTAMFPPTGEIVIENDVITYTGTTATTFTGCAGALAHATGVSVYPANAGIAPAWRLYGSDYVPCPCDAATTTTTQAIGAGAATIFVASTTNFPTKGQINIEGNLITYTGTTATTFTGCTDATAHLTSANVDFCANLVLSANRPKNTARWVINISKAALDRVENLGAGTEAVVSIQTRLGTDLTTGATWPVANQPANLSTTYAWRSNYSLYHANQSFVPFSERYQFQGDPRHCPYTDVTAGHGYNWYFDNLRDAAANQVANWPGFDATRIRNTNGSDFDGWHGSGTNGTLADSIELDVPRYFQWMRNGLCTSNSIYTTLTGFSYYYMGNGNEIGYDSANGFTNSIPTSEKPFTGNQAVSRNEQSIIDAQTGGVKLIRENVNTNYWWGKAWLGELYPDSAATGWNTNGNLPTGVGTGNFVRIRRQDVRSSGVNPVAKPWSLPSGTTFSDHRTIRRLNAKGCTSFFNVGTSISTFRHEYRDATTGNLGAGGSELDATYNFPIASNTKISRPFRLDYNTTTDEFSLAEYTATRASASNLLTYYSHQDGTPPWLGSALLREQLLASDATSPSCFIAVNGIDRTVETGSAFIATYSTLTLIHTFLSAGLPATPSRVTELPQIVIKQPNDATELKDPNTITIQWSASWLRWDGLPYTPQYPAGFTEDDTVLRYALLYSMDNGATWLHIADNTPATPGSPDQALWLNDSVLLGDEAYVWDVVNQVYLDEASYLIRVEAYRGNIPNVHYSFHQQKIFVDR